MHGFSDWSIPRNKVNSINQVYSLFYLGINSTFVFSPQDYTHELICITEREKFLVPVKAIGARAILDFPDEISFGTCPVKVRANLVFSSAKRYMRVANTSVPHKRGVSGQKPDKAGQLT